jgi:acyl-homoserine-lactone acylase
VHLALDVRVGDVQYVVRNGRKVPIHGGPGDPNGQFNAIYAPFDPSTGFGRPSDGSSYIQVVTWTRGECPDVGTILTYSQSTNPSSPYFSDQAPLFSRKQWVPERFCAAAVRRHTVRTLVLAGR